MQVRNKGQTCEHRHNLRDYAVDNETLEKYRHLTGFVYYRAEKDLLENYCKYSLINLIISLLLTGFNETVLPFLWGIRYPSLMRWFMILSTLFPFFFTLLLSHLTRVSTGRYFAPKQCLLSNLFIMSALS